MSWKKTTIHVPPVAFSCIQKGTGKNLLICFHGFNRNKYQFLDLFQNIPIDWQVISLDMPGFGETILNGEPEEINISFLKSVLLKIQEDYPDKNIYLMGFSLGGRFVLSMFQHIDTPVKGLILMAPEGLNRSFLYRAGTHYFGVRFINFLTTKPEWLLKLADMLDRKKLLPKSLSYFHRYISDKIELEYLRQVWNIYFKFRIDIGRLKRQSKRFETSWHIIWGKYDTVLPPVVGEEFVKNISGSKFYTLYCGHHILHSRPAEAKKLIEKILAGF